MSGPVEGRGPTGYMKHVEINLQFSESDFNKLHMKLSGAKGQHAA
jgi:hypothetical protein